VKENILAFPDRNVVREEAALWLIALDGDAEPAPQTLASLHQWLERSPVHRQELHNLALTWKRMNVLTELAVPLGRMETPKPARRLGLLRREGGIKARAALTGVLLVFLLAFALVIGLPPQRYQESSGAYATRVGEQREALLADGSVILLNTNSEVRVAYSRDFRDIQLVRGEAEFRVAKNPSRPFRVYAGAERIQALGTAFTVYLRDGAVDVLVTEGAVAVATRSEEPSASNKEPSASSSKEPVTTAAPSVDYTETLRTLKAGQRARLNAEDSNKSAASALDAIEVVEEPDAIARKLAWREGLLIFKGDPLEEVVREISRYTTMTIEIADAKVGATRIGGQFPVGETDAMLDVFESGFGLRVTRLSADRVRISAL
jgi:transmembrane sensor